LYQSNFYASIKGSDDNKSRHCEPGSLPAGLGLCGGRQATGEAICTLRQTNTKSALYSLLLMQKDCFVP